MAASSEKTPGVTIYTTGWCPYCHRAKALLEQKGVAYDEIDVGMERDARARMIERAGRTSVPQIFIGTGPHNAFFSINRE